MLFYIRYLQAALEKKSVPMPDATFAGEREERVRLLRADADMREIELAKERSQLVAIPDIEQMFMDLEFTSKARIMAIAPRLVPELVGETSRVMIQAKIEKPNCSTCSPRRTVRQCCVFAVAAEPMRLSLSSHENTSCLKPFPWHERSCLLWKRRSGRNNITTRAEVCDVIGTEVHEAAIDPKFTRPLQTLDDGYSKHSDSTLYSNIAGVNSVARSELNKIRC
jgi:hypothetical protein